LKPHPKTSPNSKQVSHQIPLSFSPYCWQRSKMSPKPSPYLSWQKTV
jgi:hypothetical protein